MKYTAKIHIYPDSDTVQFIGTVSANTLQSLKKAARDQCRRINHHRGRVHLEITADHLRDPREVYINIHA